MRARDLATEFVRLEIAAGSMLGSDAVTPGRMRRFADFLQAEHDKEIARLRALIGSRATALQTIGDTMMERHGAPTARPVWKEADRLTGMAELPSGVEATG